MTCDMCEAPATHYHENHNSGETFTYCEAHAKWARMWFGGVIIEIEHVLNSSGEAYCDNEPHEHGVSDDIAGLVDRKLCRACTEAFELASERYWLAKWADV